MQANRRRGIVWVIFAVLLPFAPAAAQSLHQGEVLRITRAVSPVRVDGALDDEAWKAVPIACTRSVPHLSASALFAYKLNWQSVLFVGYGDDRELSHEYELEKTGRQFFTKVSYAFQR